MIQDIRDAIQNMIPLDTPVTEPLIEESTEPAPRPPAIQALENKAEQIGSVLGLAAAIDRSNATEQELLKKREALEALHPRVDDNYDRSKLIAEITKKPTQPAMTQEELEESRKTFDKVAAGGKTLDMMLNHLMNL